MVIQKKLYTVDEFEAFLQQPENANRRFELIDGEIVEKSMPTEEHGIIALNIGTEINLYLRQNPIGRAAVEARHRPTGDDHNDRLPDVSFVIGFDKPVVRRGPADFMPDLAVEVQSPDDSLKEMGEHARFFLANGTHMVWLVYPTKRIVEVLTQDKRELLTEDDTLSGGEVLPGFAVPVRNLFFNL